MQKILSINAKTKMPYTGNNLEVLADVTEEVATFVQWKELGRQVKKGSKGIELHKVGEFSKVKEGKTVDGKYLKKFWVFKYSDTEETKV